MLNLMILLLQKLNLFCKKNKYMNEFLKDREEKITSSDLEIVNAMRHIVHIRALVMDLTKEGLIVFDFMNNIRILIKPLSLPFYDFF